MSNLRRPWLSLSAREARREIFCFLWESAAFLLDKTFIFPNKLQRQKSKARGQPEAGSFWDRKGRTGFSWSGSFGCWKKCSEGGGWGLCCCVCKRVFICLFGYIFCEFHCSLVFLLLKRPKVEKFKNQALQTCWWKARASVWVCVRVCVCVNAENSQLRFKTRRDSFHADSDSVEGGLFTYAKEQHVDFTRVQLGQTSAHAHHPNGRLRPSV